MENLSDAFDAQLLFDHPDPYPIFAMLRNTQPVAWIDMMRRPAFIVSKYDDCLTILKDAETFSSRANAEVGRFFGRTLVEMDGREHTRHRALVQQAFVPKAMDAIVPVMESLVQELLDGAARERRVDLVERFTERFPVQVIAHIVGVPRADYARFQRWTIDLVGFAKDPAEGHAAAAAIADYLLPIVRARRAEPRDDVISRLVTGTVDGAGLTDDEVISFLRLLLPAGAETTFRLIGNMLFALLTERSRFERLRADRTLVGWAIEETLRWETSILFVGRESTRATELRGVPIPAGRMVFALLASGNRDEDHYPDPDRYDLDRHADDHLSFGFGRHHCLGYHLARQEAVIALGAVLDRLPNLRLDPDAPAPTITGLAFRSPKALPVLLD
jgi:cytochrome P450